MQLRIDATGVWDGENCYNCTVLVQSARRARLQFGGGQGRTQRERVRTCCVACYPTDLGVMEWVGDDTRPGNVTVKVVPSPSDEVKLSEPPR